MSMRLHFDAIEHTAYETKSRVVMQDIEQPNDETPVERETWSAPKLVELEKLAQTSKLSYNTEGGALSGIS